MRLLEEWRGDFQSPAEHLPWTGIAVRGWLQAALQLGFNGAFYERALHLNNTEMSSGNIGLCNDAEKYILVIKHWQMANTFGL